MAETGKLLDRVASPEDLRKLAPGELRRIVGELRGEIVAGTAVNGGHLASALGTVELTVALHYVFDTPRDRIVWDVGHQAYAHKLLTGRRKLFERLRHHDGAAPFPTPAESAYDAFIAGHAGTAISAALGFAAADARHRALAVLGDGALSCGVSLEGLNNIGRRKNMIVVLNDNRMSISPNVGALRLYFNRMISARGYNRTKEKLKRLLAHLPGYEHVLRAIQKSEETLKNVFLPSGFFEALGLRYYGPVNGHDLGELVRTFRMVSELRRPAVVHVLTAKGRGYAPAERDPEKFHGVGPFDPATGLPRSAKKGESFSDRFGRELVRLAAGNPKIHAVTAAMQDGTGLCAFARRYPDRFYDTGIAEEHAVTFAAGLAAGGMRPVAALYSTFLQRAFDGVFHDVCLQNLPVVFAVDRAGAVEDGPTHHGIYDLGFLREMPHLTIMNPATPDELAGMLETAFAGNAPSAVRYPRGGLRPALAGLPTAPVKIGRGVWLRDGVDAAIFALGAECATALDAAALLARENISIGVFNVRFVKPFDAEALSETMKRMPVFTLEDHVTTGGLAAAAREVAPEPLAGAFGWPDAIVPHGEDAVRREEFGMTADAIARKIRERLDKR